MLTLNTTSSCGALVVQKEETKSEMIVANGRGIWSSLLTINTKQLTSGVHVSAASATP